MHFAPMEIRTVGVSWRQIKAADHSNLEPFPLAVPPTIHSPFLSMCGKGWLRPSSDSCAHTSNHCHQSKRERWKASEFRKRNSTVESALQVSFIFAHAKLISALKRGSSVFSNSPFYVCHNKRKRTVEAVMLRRRVLFSKA